MFCTAHNAGAANMSPTPFTLALLKSIVCLTLAHISEEGKKPGQNQHHSSDSDPQCCSPGAESQVRDSVLSLVADCCLPGKSCPQATLALGRAPTSRGILSLTRAWAMAVHRTGLAAGSTAAQG